jgi:hypothetical protein
MSEIPAESSDEQTAISWLGALLHERHHWLQCISTTSGLALTLMLELRSSSIPLTLNPHELRRDDVPILQFAPDTYEGRRDATISQDKQGAAELWETLEILRRTLSGARKGDIDCLLRAGKYPSFKTASDLIEPILASALQNEVAAAQLREIWARWHEFDQVREPEDRILRNFPYRGWGVGARHFFECGARINEMLLMAVRLGPKRTLDTTILFRGVYGVANELFYRELGDPTLAKEVALAWACDAALRGRLPPITPFLAFRGTPAVGIFLSIVEALRDFPFPAQGPDITNPEYVLAYVQRLERHLAERNEGLSKMLSMTTETSNRLLGHLGAEAVSKGLFNLGADGFPIETAATSRLTYFLANSSSALTLRQSHPEFFCLPVCHYLHNRQAFHELFDSFMPPLVSYHSIGIHPTRDIQGWSEFFIGSAVTHELLLWLAVGERNDFDAAITPFLNTAQGYEFGRAIVRRITRGLLRDSELADHLIAGLQ